MQSIEESYARCEYSPGMFRHEAYIRFAGDRGWICVNREDVIALKDGGCAVRVHQITSAKRSGKITVWITDTGEQRKTVRNVAIDDLVDFEFEFAGRIK